MALRIRSTTNGISARKLVPSLRPVATETLPGQRTVVVESKSFVQNERVRGWIAGALGVALTVLLPYVQLGVIYRLWEQYTMKVNVSTCTCSCWDTHFKGPYETGVAHYKHMYVNATRNSYAIWVVTAAATYASCRCFRRMIKALLSKRLRIAFAVLFAANVYPNYYSWWGYLNSLNDEFYSQWYHQALFTITELISTAIAVNLLDKKKADVQVWHLATIFAIGASHCLCSLTDQFASNVLFGRGSLHQTFRDVGFMASDVLHVLVAYVELRKMAAKKRLPLVFLLSNKTVLLVVLYILGMWLLTFVL